MDSGFSSGVNTFHVLTCEHVCAKGTSEMLASKYTLVNVKYLTWVFVDMNTLPWNR